MSSTTFSPRGAGSAGDATPQATPSRDVGRNVAWKSWSPWKSSLNDSMLNFSLSTISVQARQSELLPPNDPNIVLVDKVITDITALEAKQASGSPYNKDERGTRCIGSIECWRLQNREKLYLAQFNVGLNDLDDEPMASAARSRARFETLTKECLDTTQSPSTIRNGGEKLLRDFLLGLVEDIQYFHTREHSLRPLKKKLAGRVASLGWLPLRRCYPISSRILEHLELT